MDAINNTPLLTPNESQKPYHHLVISYHTAKYIKKVACISETFFDTHNISESRLAVAVVSENGTILLQNASIGSQILQGRQTVLSVILCLYLSIKQERKCG